jgi:hypothetical protein
MASRKILNDKYVVMVDDEGDDISLGSGSFGEVFKVQDKENPSLMQVPIYFEII